MMGKKKVKPKTSRKRSGNWSSFSRKAKDEETAVVPPKPTTAAPRTEERAPAPEKRAPLPPTPTRAKPKVAVAKAERYVVPEKNWLPIDTIEQVKGAWSIVASPTTPEVYAAPLGVVNLWKQRIKDRAAELKIEVGPKKWTQKTRRG